MLALRGLDEKQEGATWNLSTNKHFLEERVKPGKPCFELDDRRTSRMHND